MLERRESSFKKLISKFHPKLLVITEPMISNSRLDMWRDKLCFDCCCSNFDEGGKIWMFWPQDLKLVVDCMGDQFLTVLSLIQMISGSPLCM